MAPYNIILEYAFIFLISTATVTPFTLQDEMDMLSRLDVVGYAALHNLTLERVPAVTDDGWVLELHRVRNMKIFDAALSTPVFVSHGCTCSSVDFMVNPRNESLIFLLADLGYDVWAVNYRANKFSNRVMENSRPREPNATEYYRATWQYMAERDVPAALDKVLEVTGQEKLFVIGQSMGATILFSALSEIKRFDDKILLYGALVPVIKFGNDTSLTLQSAFSAAPFIPHLARGKTFEALFGQQVIDLEIPGVRAFQDFLESAICSDVPQVCDLVQGMLEPSDKEKQNPHINQARDELYHIVYPAGVTAMNLYQFARQFKKPVWEKLDYNEVKQTHITNRQEYGKPKPPKYNFSDIAVPVQLYFTRNDKYVGVETAMKVVKELSLRKSDYLMIEGNRLEHHDVLWGWDARCWVYNHLLERMQGIDQLRSYERLQYRRKMKNFEKSLPFEDGCKDVKARRNR